MADFAQLKEWALSDWKAQRNFREEAEEEYNFINGHQWTDEEIAQLEEKQRAPIVFNRTAAVIASVAGSEVNNRTEVRFIPREIGDVKPNEVLTAGAEWFRDQANAEDEESQSFYDLLICGIGWTETKLDFDKDPEGHPEVQRISPLEMFWDCHAHRRGLSDASRAGRVHTLSIADAKDMFRDHDIVYLYHNQIDAVGDKVEVHVDGGIRSGQDVFKAVAMGAHSTYIGRAYIYGLGAMGKPGKIGKLGCICRITKVMGKDC